MSRRTKLWSTEGLTGTGADTDYVRRIETKVYEANMELPRRGLITHLGEM